MPNKRDVVMWDSCIIIDAIQKSPQYWSAIEPFVADAEAGKLLIVVSEISVAEVSSLGGLNEQGVSLEEQAKLIREWFENPYVSRRQQHAGISELAAEYGRTYSLKAAPDRVVLATAVFEKIPVLHTRDGAGASPRSKMLLPLDRKVGNPPLRIEVPNYRQGLLSSPSGGIIG